MSFSLHKLNVLGAIKTLPVVAAGYRIFWPNAEEDGDDEQVTKYVVVDVIWGVTDRADIGTGGTNARQRTNGILQVAVYGELGIGENEILELADSIAALTRHKTQGTVVFRTPSVATRGRVNDGRNWRVDVETPFYADATT
jgi:hypothetical protein